MSAVYPGIDFLSYNMTISMFDMYLQRIEIQRTRHIIDMSQATIYAQATAESRRSMFNGWIQTINQITTVMQKSVGESLVTWNGASLNRKQLVATFKRHFGRRAVV